jgi:outer membrane protein TolC
MKQIRYIITFLTILLVDNGLKAQDTKLYLTLQECRSMAIENSEVVKIANENINKAQGEKTAAKSAWFPNISANALGVYSKQKFQQDIYLPTAVPDPATGELVPNVMVDPSTGIPITGPDGNPIYNVYGYLPFELTINGGAVAGVSAEQPIYAGGKIIAGNKMAQIGENMAFANKELKEAELIYYTDQYYYQYLSVKEKVRLAKEYQKLLDELARVVNDSYETGMTNRNELLKVQVKYNDALLQVQKAETGLALSQMSLCRVLGLDLNSSIVVNDSITNIQFCLDTIHSFSATDRIEYQLLSEQVNMAEQKIKMTRGDYMPTVGVSIGYNYFMIGLDNMDNYDQHGYSALATVSIPITTFGERKGKMKAAKADCNIRQLELEQNTKYLQLEIEQARLNYINAYTQVEMTQVSLEQAYENMRISDDNYSLGMETIVNLLEAKAEWQKSYSNKIDALTNYKIQESNLLRVSNNLKY